MHSHTHAHLMRARFKVREIHHIVEEAQNDKTIPSTNTSHKKKQQCLIKSLNI